MNNKKLEQLQKMYEEGLITESELKSKREKIISEIIDSELSSKSEAFPEIMKPKKRHILRKIILTVVAIFLGLIIIGAVFDTEETNSTSSSETIGQQEKTIEKVSTSKTIKVENEPQKNVANPNEKPVNKMGKWIDYSEKEEVKIYSVEKTGYLSDYLIAPDGKYYLKCKVGCRNISDRPLQSFANQKYTLVSPKGIKYYPDENVSMIEAYNLLSDIFSGNPSSWVLQPYEAYKEEIAFLVSDKEVKDSGWKILIDDKIEIAIKF